MNAENNFTKDYKYLLEVEQTINYFATSLFGQNSVDDILWDIAKNCIGRLGFEDCVIYLTDHTRNVLVQKAAYGPKNPERFEIKSPIEIEIGEGIVGYVALHGTAEIVNNTAFDSRYIVDDELRLSEIAVPIKAGKKVLGVIDSESNIKNFYTPAHLHILETIASLSANKILRVQAEMEAQENKLQLEIARTRVAEMKMLALQAQMNPHFLYNSLSVLQYFIIDNQNDKAANFVVSLSRLLRQVFNVANREKISLQTDIEILNEYLKLEQQRLSDDFIYEICIEQSIDTKVVMVPPMMLQPLIDNALWHGLMGVEGEKKISVSVFVKEKMLHLQVNDNGIGHEYTKDKKNKISKNEKPGWQLLNERLLLLREKYGSESIDMLIEESDENAQKYVGTCITIMLPLIINDELIQH
nr:histidine kinase [Bacteroidota bacterium]